MPAPTGLVLVLLSEPKGEAVPKPGLLLSFSFSSKLGPNPSLKSVLRRRSEGGGEDTLPSSLENLLLPPGDARGLEDCNRSPESLRFPPGRDSGELFIML